MLTHLCAPLKRVGCPYVLQGGFTASAGLEAAWQLGALQGDRALEDFVWSSTLAHCDVSLPLVIAAWDVAERSRSRQDDNDVVLHDESSNRETNVVDRNADPPYLGDLLRLDAEHDAVLSGNAVARRSSVRCGASRARTSRDAFRAS